MTKAALPPNPPARLGPADAATSPDQIEGSLWTVDDVACFLGVAPKTVRKWQLNGALPFVKLGGKLVRFRPAAVQEWVDDHVVTPGPADEESPLVADLKRRLAQGHRPR
jgi:excisionase family DNA binding protein